MVTLSTALPLPSPLTATRSSNASASGASLQTATASQVASTASAALAHPLAVPPPAPMEIDKKQNTPAVLSWDTLITKAQANVLRPGYPLLCRVPGNDSFKGVTFIKIDGNNFEYKQGNEIKKISKENAVDWEFQLVTVLNWEQLCRRWSDSRLKIGCIISVYTTDFTRTDIKIQDIVNKKEKGLTGVNVYTNTLSFERNDIVCFRIPSQQTRAAFEKNLAAAEKKKADGCCVVS